MFWLIYIYILYLFFRVFLYYLLCNICEYIVFCLSGFLYYVLVWYLNTWFDIVLCLFYRVFLYYVSVYIYGDCVVFLINAGRVAVNIIDRRGCIFFYYVLVWDYDVKWDFKIYLYCVLIINIIWLKVFCLEFRMF